MRIHDGEGNGPQAGVTSRHRLKTEASTRSAQSRASLEDGNAFQVISEDVDVTASSQSILVIKNNDSTKKAVITYIRVKTIGVAAASVDAYWTLNLGGDYASGGSLLDPTNINTSSGITALNMDCYDGTTPIVTSGTPVKFDKNFSANDMVTYNKEGALVIAPGGMLSIDFKGSTVAGVAVARASFYLTENGGT